jgi:hypothetical protein
MPGFDLDRPIIGKVEGPKLRRLQKYFSVPLAVGEYHFYLFLEVYRVWLMLEGVAMVARQLLENIAANSVSSPRSYLVKHRLHLLPVSTDPIELFALGAPPGHFLHFLDFSQRRIANRASLGTKLQRYASFAHLYELLFQER